MVGASYPVLLGNSVSTYTGRAGSSQDVSYDVYVKLGVDKSGRPTFSDAIVHFKERRNAVTYRRQLEAQGETVHIQKSTVYDFSEVMKAEWFMDYEPKASPAEPRGTSQIAAGPDPPPPGDGSESSGEHREPWYKGWFGG